MTRVLVTGGTGFIGSRVAARLAASGAEVHLLVRAASSGARLGPLWKKLPRHVGDLGDAASLTACLKEARPDIVLHLAKDREGASFEKEAAATLRLAAALQAACPGLKRWVRTAHSVREKFGRGADAELARAAASRYGLSIATLELFQVYGPGQEERDFPLSLIRAIKEDHLPPDFEGGSRDFVYVEDVARAYALAATAPGAPGPAIQIGSGAALTQAQAAKLALKLLGQRTSKKTAAAAGGEGHAADLSAARERLGWAPETSLEAGLTKLIEWWREVSVERGAARRGN